MTATAAAPESERAALEAALAGRYAIERELGRGGMGVVYLARDLALERPVAIKLLPPALAAQPELRDRFLRETRTAAGLSHPNIVPIHAVEERAGLVYFVMGYIDGETLSERVRRAGPLPAAEVARVLQEAAWALSYAHGRGIVHRDVKADNILIERATGRAFITDFGIARLAGSTLTAVGESLGTPQYMSPEQATGETVDARSDLYSLGIVGFFALTGRLPFEAPTMQAVLAMQVTKAAPPVASLRAGIPARLAEAIDRCLRKEPESRFQSAEQFVEALQGVQGAAAAEIAPPVRNFQRMAEVSVSMVIILIGAVWVSAASEPRYPEYMLLWVVIGLLATLLQLGARARMLLDQGFTHEDLRAAFDREAKDQQAEADAIGVGEQRHRSIVAPMVLAMLSGASIAGGIVLASASHLHTIRGMVAVTLMGLGFLMGMMFFQRSRLSRLERHNSKWAAAVWLGWFGRTFFRVAAIGRRRVAAPAATPGRSAGALWSSLPRRTRAELRELGTTIERLEAASSALDRRISELDRAIAEASADAGGGTISERQRSLIDDLRRARTTAEEQRAEAAASLETLRLQLLKIRSGAGRAADAASDVAAARSLAEQLVTVR